MKGVESTCPGCTALVSTEHPCSCVPCDCGELAPYVDDIGHRCACGWRSDVCCGAPMTFDATMRGTTQGGLAIVGALVCVSCGAQRICRRTKPADAIDWKLAKSGLSLTAGGIKVRAETNGDDVIALMARIVRLPDLEIEIDRLRALLQRRALP